MAENEKTPMDWSAHVAYLRELSALVRDENLSEIEVESGGVRLFLKGAVWGDVLAAPVMSAPLNVTEAPQTVPSAAPPKAKAALAPIVSPMVGVFYRAPSPGEPNFVEIGDKVEIGQTIGTVEAMKTFNEILAEIEGIVAEIPAQNAALVETGEVLIFLET